MTLRRGLLSAEDPPSNGRQTTPNTVRVVDQQEGTEILQVTATAPRFMFAPDWRAQTSATPFVLAVVAAVIASR